MADKSLSERIKEKLADIKLLLKFDAVPVAGAAPAAPAPPDPGADDANPTGQNSAKLKDGTEIRWTGDLAVGTEMQCVTPNGVQPCPDGVMEMEDGTMVTMAGGKVTDIKAAVAPQQGMSEDQVKQRITSVVEKFESEIAGLKSEIEKFKTEHTEGLHKLNQAFGKTVEIVEAMNTTPPKQEEVFNPFPKVDTGKNLELLAQSFKDLQKK